MKKILASLLLLSVAVGYADGQTALTGNKFADNWAIGVNAGGTTPLMHHSFFKNMRPVVGVHVDKYLTPTFGLSLEAMGSFNTTGSKTAFDASNVSLLGLVNLGNLFAGYNGAPRLFEVEAVAGIGWLPSCKRRADGTRKCVREKETRSVKAVISNHGSSNEKGGRKAPFLCAVSIRQEYLSASR